METAKDLLICEGNEEEEEEQEPSEGHPEAEEEAEAEEENEEDSSWRWEPDNRYEEWRALFPYRLALLIIIPVLFGTLFLLRNSSNTIA